MPVVGKVVETRLTLNSRGSPKDSDAFLASYQGTHARMVSSTTARSRGELQLR